jgi:hypothetical protein
VTPNSEDVRSHHAATRIAAMHPVTQELLLDVQGLQIHEHEESFPSEGEDEEEDVSLDPSDDSSLEDDEEDSSDEDTILAPRTRASLGHPVSDDALRARFPHYTASNSSLSSLLKSKDAAEFQSPPRRSGQAPSGIESISLVEAEEFATRSASIPISRASSSKSSRRGKKSKSSNSKSTKPRSKDRNAQMYALWTAAITAGFLVGFGAGYAWKEYLTGGTSGEDARRVGCAWCGEGKR